MSKEIKQPNYFSVPYGRSAEGTLLVAQVCLSAPLRPGQMERIGRQIERIAAIAAAPIPEEETTLQQRLLLGEAG